MKDNPQHFSFLGSGMFSSDLAFSRAFGAGNFSAISAIVSTKPVSYGSAKGYFESLKDKCWP